MTDILVFVGAIFATALSYFDWLVDHGVVQVFILASCAFILFCALVAVLWTKEIGGDR